MGCDPKPRRGRESSRRKTRGDARDKGLRQTCRVVLCGPPDERRESQTFQDAVRSRRVYSEVLLGAFVAADRRRFVDVLATVLRFVARRWRVAPHQDISFLA